jgi:hypothetical protein
MLCMRSHDNPVAVQVCTPKVHRYREDESGKDYMKHKKRYDSSVDALAFMAVQVSGKQAPKETMERKRACIGIELMNFGKAWETQARGDRT